MIVVGELLLLGAFVAVGYAAFAALAADRFRHKALARSADVAAIVGLCALTGVLIVLARALVLKDFRFAYAAQYSSRLLPWPYAFSALWVGQAGSLLLWAWFVGIIALACRFGRATRNSELRGAASGLLFAYLAFLLAVMIFGADPMTSSAAAPTEGAGLSPLLQHPAMLIHPPIVFAAYALWSVPCSLAMAALAKGRLNGEWLAQARPWAVCAWAVLGGGILLGADWAYEELGWGGYWGWDPVENGSLIPWLTGTAFVHTGMALRYRGVLHKSALALAIATFGLCNFATFLTRSGIFSSLHAFSQSPLGWMFLLFTIALACGGGALVAWRRATLAPSHRFGGLLSRESLVLVAVLALSLLASVAFAGTLVPPLSDLVLGRKVIVGPALYNQTLIPTGLLLLVTTALAPLTRWGKAPSAAQLKMLSLAMVVGVAAIVGVVGKRPLLETVVIGCAAMAAATLIGALIIDVRRRASTSTWIALWQTMRTERRRYAAFVVHLGIMCLAIGIAGSSLRSRQHTAALRPGETWQWDETAIRLVRLEQERLDDKVVVAAELLVTPPSATPFTLRPAQHWHRLQNEWTTEVAIQSTWSGDFYAILHGGEATEMANFTFVVNPMMRWLWMGGFMAASAAFVTLLPARRADAKPRLSETPSGPHFVRYPRHRLAEVTHG